jgi:hypothetical protein
MLHGGFAPTAGAEVSYHFRLPAFMRFAPYVRKYKPNASQTASPNWYFFIFFDFILFRFKK